MPDEPKIRALMIRGPFTDDEVAEMVALLRRIDDKRPTSNFEIYMDAPDASVFDAKRATATILPPAEGRRTQVYIYPTARDEKSH